MERDADRVGGARRNGHGSGRVLSELGHGA